MTLSTPIYVVTESGEALQLPAGCRLRLIRYSNVKACAGTVTAVTHVARALDVFSMELVYVDAGLVGQS